jgi:NhaP-type Na+/H+ or K+/H+ antiporter
VLYGFCKLIHANELLAAFTGGITFASMCPQLASAFRRVGEPAAEATKLGVLLLFGAVLDLLLLMGAGISGLVFALITLLATRPLALVFAMLGSKLPRKEWFTAAWFGPKGFSSLLFALLMLHGSEPRALWLFRMVALVIVISIVAHSTTDVLAARLFKEQKEAAAT